MNSRLKKISAGIMCALAMSFLILDAKCALIGAKEGVKLSLYTVIPALFPFCVLSIMFRSMIAGKRIKALSPLERLCGLPKGAGIIFVLGALGGYPIGAVCIEQARKQGELHDRDAKRMVGFCSNAGPSFIFGMLSGSFESFESILVIWIIQLTSAILTGALLPNKSKKFMAVHKGSTVGFNKAINDAVRSMANVCSLVIMFRVIIAILNKWIMWYLPSTFKTIFVGLVELTNGIIDLQGISNESFRFVAASVLLSFGGICVAMQTASVSAPGTMRTYITAKLLQGSISVVLSIGCLSLKEPIVIKYFMISIPLLVLLVVLIKKLSAKKTVAFPA